MILQSTYRVVARDLTHVTVEDENLRVLILSVHDWEEMGKPEKVSVTIMRLMVRTGAPDAF